MFSTSSSDATSTQDQKRILCYGDSLTAGTSDDIFRPYPYAPPWLEQRLNSLHQADKSTTFVVRYRGMPGWTAEAMLDAADDSQYGLRSAIRTVQNPSLACVIILSGTNDLGMSVAYPEEERLEKIMTPIQALHEMAWKEGVPKTIAISIPPSGYQAQVNVALALAQRVNAVLKMFCEASNGRATFVEFPFEFVKGGENWSVDTLHFSPKGYQVLGEYLAEPVLDILNAS